MHPETMQNNLGVDKGFDCPTNINHHKINQEIKEGNNVGSPIVSHKFSLTISRYVYNSNPHSCVKDEQLQAINLYKSNLVSIKSER